MPYRIFISHSHKDTDLAVELDNSLRPRRGFSVFRANYDSELGDQIPRKIIKKIAESNLFIVIWSRHSSRSNWVNQEIGMALVNRLSILPIVLGRGLALPETLAAIEKKGKVVSLRGRRGEAFNSIKAAIKKDMDRKGFTPKKKSTDNYPKLWSVYDDAPSEDSSESPSDGSEWNWMFKF